MVQNINNSNEMDNRIDREVLKGKLQLLGRRYGMTQIVREYIAEAEHSDGIEYWDQFDTVNAAWDDVLEYKANQ